MDGENNGDVNSQSLNAFSIRDICAIGKKFIRSHLSFQWYLLSIDSPALMASKPIDSLSKKTIIVKMDG